jgi:hypothetical protein
MEHENGDRVFPGDGQHLLPAAQGDLVGEDHHRLLVFDAGRQPCPVLIEERQIDAELFGFTQVMSFQLGHSAYQNDAHIQLSCVCLRPPNSENPGSKMITVFNIKYKGKFRLPRRAWLTAGAALPLPLNGSG